VGACPECAAPLRHDQRYCLQCGAPAQEHPDSAETIGFAPLAPPPAGSSPASPPPHLLGGTPVAAGQEPGSAITVIAAVGVLLLAIGVGVLIGRSGSGNASTGGSPQVITLSTPTTSTTSTETASSGSTGSGSHHKAAGSSKGLTGPREHAAPPSVIKKLDEKGGGSYEQKSNNLPNVISTG
jgi:hypothetical protein